MIRDGRSDGARRGAVLVIIVLVTLAMLGLAHGLLVSAESAYTASRARARVLGLDALATGAIEAAIRRGHVPWMDTVPIAAARDSTEQTPGGLMTTTTWRHLDREGWLLEASATGDGGPSVGSRRLVWIYDPAHRIAALPGVVSTAEGAPVTALGAIVADTALPLGIVGAPALGLLDLERLLAAGDSVGPVGAPRPSESGGVCDATDHWNWGDPARPYRPCGSYFAVVASPTSLTLEGGQGQGLLVVDGDLLLRGGAALFGLVIASGRVDVVEGSRIEGRMIAYGGIAVESGSTVVGSAVWAELALVSARGRLGPAVLLHPAQRLGPDQ